MSLDWFSEYKPSRPLPKRLKDNSTITAISELAKLQPVFPCPIGPASGTNFALARPKVVRWDSVRLRQGSARKVSAVRGCVTGGARSGGLGDVAGADVLDGGVLAVGGGGSEVHAVSTVTATKAVAVSRWCRASTLLPLTEAWCEHTVTGRGA